MQPDKLSSETTTNKRITVIDALRGFALLGVILMHMLQYFGIHGVRPEEPLFPVMDEAIQWLSQNVIMGRFINIFAFLFGLSFFIQMNSAAKKGLDFRKRFLWRMAILFVIGMIGNCFFTADILSIYAVFGVIMVFLFPLKNKVLIIIASLILLGAPRVLMVGYDRITKTEQITENPNTERRQPAARPAMPDMGKPSFINSAKQNLTFKLQGKLNYQFGINGRGYLTMALFILGLVVGRLRFFETIQAKKKRNVILFGGFMLGTLVLSLMLNFIPQEPISFRMLMTPGYEIPFAAVAVSTLNDMNILFSSGALAMGFIVLYQIKGIGKYLEVITPYGRMGLTNYEMQGMLGAVLFSMWGFGSIFGSWGTTEVFALGLVVYAMQIIISKYWLKYFLYGPLEWLWRSGTYLKWQKLRKIILVPLFMFAVIPMMAITTDVEKSEQELLDLSKTKWQWMADRNVDSLNVLFHKEAVFVHMGGTMNKEQEINTIKSGGIHYKYAEIQETSIRFIDNTAILLDKIRLTAVVGGREVVNPFMVTEVYIQENGTWKLGSLSFTRLLGN